MVILGGVLKNRPTIVESVCFMFNSLARKLFLLIAIFSLGIVACGGDDGESEDNGNNGDEQTTVGVETYPNPDIVADVAWAAGQREIENVRFVDLRSPEDYAASHIVEAVNADPTRLGFGTNALPDKRSVETVVREWGVNAETLIILYDTQVSEAATWVYWVLDTYGHQDLRVLNGGFMAWNVDGRTLVLDVPQVSPSNYSLPDADPNRFASTDWVNNNRGNSGTVVVDVRLPEAYQGIDGGGHIEGAVNITADLAYANGAIREPSEIIDLYDSISDNATTVVYGDDGASGSMTYFALRAMNKNVRLYTGGWNEWTSQGLPLATGDE